MIDPFLLYPEIHFRFGGISPSRIFRREPEIIFDMPRRCAPGRTPALYIICNDTDRFPLTPVRVETETQIQEKRQKSVFTDLASCECALSLPNCRAWIIPLPRPQVRDTTMNVTPSLIYKIGKTERKTVIDNLGSRLPLKIFMAGQDFPGTYRSADIHCHSMHSRSHVEFGAPLEIIDHARHTAGLDFAAVTDHSYDLECLPKNYLQRDPDRYNWRLQQEKSYPRLCVNEEISARKEHGGVVHLGKLGSSRFIPGSGDGARPGYRRRNEPSLETICRTSPPEELLFAAHPGDTPPLMQRIFLRRGRWTHTDLAQNRFAAFQLMNGTLDAAFERARRLWINLLLQGRHIPVVAGNDAHGDFNRYRSLKTPFWSIAEDLRRYFGFCRTGITGPVPASKKDFLAAITAGRTIVTTGPAADIRCKGESCIGKTLSPAVSLELQASSTAEFGPLEECICLGGTAAGEKRIPFTQYRHTYEIIGLLPQAALGDLRYVRLECRTEVGLNGEAGRVCTSPVYIK
ncbi:MAG: CehA/McbA family metallohydrolase [Fibrobacterota bacterium]